ncbi:IclR family transcriptional regulator [Labrys wisconsinensis]|uniref:DNA-binding IclR family transcriptional regulator n=1 Tax=Labrys wisconsinensis TaxID=425677 RepID=A0ABU0JIK3_9HYPH|nr:IclR family transcriptional regulator [Labrys wisconsinensis]MDQ0474111.1 DNA-binding IclR family transcriptional regulator [Labrys wisconsinensis]
MTVSRPARPAAPPREEEAGRPEYKAPAAEKALDILEFMAGRPDGVTQTEISLGLGRSIHEIYRIIQLLEKRGYLVRTASDRYRLSLKLFELAHMHPPVNRLIDAALPVMRTLVLDTDQSCHLAVLNGRRVLIVLQIESPLPMRYSVALGSQFPILETSSGAVLLGAMPEPERAAALAEILAAGEAEETPPAIAARLEAIAGHGFEMRPSLAVEGCTNISLPVRDHRGETIAALTVPYLPQKHARFDRASVLASTRAAALDISRALGASEATLAGIGEAPGGPA